MKAKSFTSFTLSFFQSFMPAIFVFPVLMAVIHVWRKGKTMLSKSLFLRQNIPDFRGRRFFTFLMSSVGEIPRKPQTGTSRNHKYSQCSRSCIREKSYLLICACIIGDLELIKRQKKNKLRFLLYLMLLGLRNNEFTYHGLSLN